MADNIQMHSNIAFVVKDQNSLKLSAYFSSSTTSEMISGLEPTIQIIDMVSNTEVPLNNNKMTEVKINGVGKGIYIYEFPPPEQEGVYDQTHSYIFKCDGGDVLLSERYKIGSISAEELQNSYLKGITVQAMSGTTQQTAQGDFFHVRGTEFRQSFQLFDSAGQLINLKEIQKLQLYFTNEKQRFEITALNPMSEEEPLSTVPGVAETSISAKIWRDTIHPSVFWVVINEDDVNFLNYFKQDETVKLMGSITIGNLKQSLGDYNNPFFQFKILLSPAVYSPISFRPNVKF